MKERHGLKAAMTMAALMLLAGAARAGVTLNGGRVGAEDPAALAKFYQDAFGLKEVNRLNLGNTVEIMLNFGDTVDAAKMNKSAQIVIMHRDDDKLADSVPHLIFNVTDMAATVKAVKAAGGHFDNDPAPFGNTGIVIGMAMDPAGNRLELIQQPAGR
jgi:predicted enzyme related to lactoylglutathione lyase